MTFTFDDLKRVIWTFVFAFAVSLAAAASGWATLPDLSTGKAAIAAALLAGVQAGASFVKNLVLADGSKLK